MLRTTRQLQAVSSTFRGQRRILKYEYSTPEYIRRAVETGVYRTQDEIRAIQKERRESNQDLSVIMRRFRQDIVRGSAVQDYPEEYFILLQHPPIPHPLRTPVKLQRKEQQLQKEAQGKHPVQKYIRTYMKRMQQSEGSSGAPRTPEEYYQRLLGIQAPRNEQFIGQKSASVQKAYAAAIRHYQLIRTENLSEHEALRRVEELLQQEQTEEKNISFSTRQKIQQQNISTPKNTSITSKQEGDRSHKKKSIEPGSIQHLMKNVLHAEDKTLQAMMVWSERLQAVPYHEWTLGASTAMDHWIARQILKLSEETWQSLLEGDDPDLLDRGRDIIAVREAMFPETRLGMSDEPAMIQDDDELETAADFVNETERSIEEIIDSLGGITLKETSEKTSGNSSALAHDNFDSRIQALTNELQDFRRAHEQKNYDSWSDDEKSRFNMWMKEYISTLMPQAEKVDLTATREALLSQPALSEEESTQFWKALEHEREAVKLLEAMRRDGPPRAASMLQAAFWDLPYEQQLERLLDIGALRPLLDEYNDETKRADFLRRYADSLLSGVELEHLVPDPLGPITGEFVGPEVSKDARFRLELIPYNDEGDISAHEKTRTLYKTWNFYKAGRARYEEQLFTDGQLGLKYGETKEEQDESK